MPIQGDTGGGTGSLSDLAEALANVAKGQGYSVSEATVLEELRQLQQRMIANGWTEQSSFNVLTQLSVNESGQLSMVGPDGKPHVFVPGAPGTGPASDGPWQPTQPADSGTSTSTTTPHILADYVNMIYQAGLFPDADLMALANQAVDNQWDASRFQNELFKTPEYDTAQAPTFEQYVYSAGLTMTAGLQALVDQAVNENWSTARFQVALQQTQEFQDRGALTYDAILGQYGLDPGKYQDLINRAVAGHYTADEFLYFLKQTPEYQQRAGIQYKAFLSQYGLSGDNLSNLVAEAVQKNYNDTEFLYFLRQTPEYRKRFAGIFDPQTGQLRMSEEAYLGLEQSLKQLGKEYGATITSHDIAVSINKGITPDLYEERLQALRRLHEYQPAMNAFRQTLAARGLVDANKEFTRKELEDWVTGKANPKWYQVWQETQGRTAAFVAGLTVGGDKDNFSSIARSDILRVLKTLPGEQTEGELQQYFQRIGQQFADVLPLDEAKMFGVTKQTIERANVGGKGAIQAQRKIERAQGTAQAFNEAPRAVTQTALSDYDVTRPQTQ